MSAASPTTPPLLHGRYRILSRLGEGRLATVYHAEDERLKRRVIVHLLRTDLIEQPNLRQRFEEEARRGAQRSHPGLLEVYDSGDVGGRPYMVTEDINGRPLADVGTLSASEALSVVRTIVSAVALAQAQGLPHPPVSSSNVWLLGPDGAAGRTVLLENWNTSPSATTLDLAPYRAPERIGGSPPSPATVVYALGVLAWEAFVGRRPFTGATVEAIVQGQQRGDPPPISQARPALFSPGLDRIVGQAVASDPQRRYPTPTDFARALDHYADAISAQTGRLAALPATGAYTLPQPAIEQEPRPSRLRLPGRRQAAAAQVAPQIAPPPPPPVINAAPPPQTRTIVAPAQYDQAAVDRQIQRSVKREVRRQGCQRALIKRGLQLIVVFLVLYGGYLGVRYALEYATGQIAQINPRDWISAQLPDPNDFIPDWLRDPGSLTATYRVTGDINLRSAPGATSSDTIVRVLPPGTLIQQLGSPQPDPNGGPNQWIQVVTLDAQPTTGYIALLEDRLEQP